jgi:16S rRNA (cytosine967-C5)-methyltransferase
VRRGPGTARSEAARTIHDVIGKGQPASPLLLARSADLSPEDASLMREIVLGVLRHRSALDAELASACRAPLGRLAPGLREVLEVALYQLRHLERVPDYAAVDEAVRDARRRAGEKAAKLVNAVLRRLLRSPDRKSQLPDHKFSGTAADLSLRFSHPEFLVSRWLLRFGPETTIRILETDNAPSGIDLMANPRRTSREALAAALAAGGVTTEPSPFSLLALTVISGNPLKSTLLSLGHFSVQDTGSQALVLLLPSGGMLLDLAAAPGGKSFAAVALGRARRAIALDRSPARLLRVREAGRRLGIPEVHPAAADVLAPPLPSGRFDRVLFDAPCSGTGTLRKNPEIRYRVTPEAIERLARAQKEGLAASASLLAPGGFLLYSTCSLELEENEAVVEAVLVAVPRLELAAIEAPDALRPFVSGARFQLLPGPTNDGFTAHLLRRRTAANT